ncbi:MAG: hypothetical protein ABEK16_02415 [Candidatus Nanohalobium sp.]
MSEDDDTGLGTSLKRIFLPMLHTPGTIKDWYSHGQEEKYEEKDDVWSDFHIFHDDWIEIANKKEWYDAPHVPQIYKDHKKIVKQNMGMKRPFEYFYYEKPENGDFESNMYVKDRGLPSGYGNLKMDIEITLPGGPPSGENDACLVEYFVTAKIGYKDVPDGIDYLPRFLAYPLNRFFKWAFIEFVAEEQIEYDGEYAQERVNEYFQYLRKYHGEEPLQAKSRQAVFKPSVEDGVFFQ